MNMDLKSIFFDIEEHLLNDNKPSIHVEKLLEDGLLKEYPFSMIGDLKEVPQNPKYHPEGDVFIHTMMVIDEGAKNREKSKNKRAFMWALLLHDIGKKPTTKNRKGKLTSYNHDSVGQKMTREFLNYFNEDEEFINEVCGLVRWHMQSLFVNKSLPFQDIKGMLKEVDKNEIVLVALSDRLGRGRIRHGDVNNTLEDINKFKKILNKSDYKSEK